MGREGHRMGNPTIHNELECKLQVLPFHASFIVKSLTSLLLTTHFPSESPLPFFARKATFRTVTPLLTYTSVSGDDCTVVVQRFLKLDVEGGAAGNSESHIGRGLWWFWKQ